MERRSIPDSENRLLVMYTLRTAGAMTEEELLQLLTDSGELTYFEMRLTVAELTDQGLVQPEAHPLGEMLTLTETGAEQLELFFSRLPMSRRQRIEDAAAYWRKAFRAEQQAPAETLRLADGTACLCLRLMDGDRLSLELLLPLYGLDVPQLLQQRWQRCAAQVYRYILQTLIGEKQVSQWPEWATLTPQGDQLLLTLTQEGEEALTLTLLVDAEDTAKRCAAAWPEQARALRREILALLTQEAALDACNSDAHPV